MERLQNRFFALHSLVNDVKLSVVNVVGRNVKVLEAGMAGQRPCELGQVNLAEAVVLHGKLRKVGVVVEHADHLIYCFTRKMIPGDIEEY